ncbi:hypothetical protein H6F32_13250 [Anabaena sp. FACHB-1237]|uniref:hypothetical protein n=1 Tax=Anabaena sp. FACHB-1237 TaxID=2692769 RepID=UPI00168136C5|nr:hypothetical protein [Anabaena sp. FACHB-1237]MBD2138533.1 hypothetical protein [Anabaena sp. FACHB-1237]
MSVKYVANILGMGIFTSCILADSLPTSAQVIIPNGNLINNLNSNYDQPIVPILNTVTGLDVNSLILETNMGTISQSNFQDIGQLIKGFNLTDITQNINNINNMIGNSGSLSGLISGRLQTVNGNFFNFTKIPISINGITSSGKDINLLTNWGNLTINGDQINNFNNFNNFLNIVPISSLNLTNLGTVENINDVIFNPQLTNINQVNLSQLGFNLQGIQSLINNPNFMRFGSPGLNPISGPASRIYPGLTVPK